MISNFDLSMSYSSTQSIVSSTFSKVALHEQWRGQGRVALGSALSFVSFSLGLFLQRKAAKPFSYQDLLDAFSFATRGTNLSCLTYVSHLLRKTESEKALQKENAVFALTPRRAVAFEKATQNNRAKRVRTHL